MVTKHEEFDSPSGFKTSRHYLVSLSQTHLPAFACKSRDCGKTKGESCTHGDFLYGRSGDWFWNHEQ